MSEKKRRLEWLDVAKLIGIFFVLANHQVGFTLGPLSKLGGTFYMAVFFVAAGYTFYPKQEETVASFARKRAKRLLIPYFCVNGLLFLVYFIKDLTFGTLSSDSSLSLVGVFYSRNRLWSGNVSSNVFLMNRILNAPTWFLTCLFLSIVLYKMLSTGKTQDNHRKMWITTTLFLLSCGYHYISPLLLPWSIDALPMCIAFMGVGEYLREKKIIERLVKGPYFLLPLIVLFVFLTYFNGSGNMSIGDYGKSMILYFINGSLGSLLCMIFSFYITRFFGAFGKFVAVLGRNTLPIMCFHLIIFNVLEVGLHLLGVNTKFQMIQFMIILSAFILALPGVWKEKKENANA